MLPRSKVLSISREGICSHMGGRSALELRSAPPLSIHFLSVQHAMSSRDLGIKAGGEISHARSQLDTYLFKVEATHGMNDIKRAASY